MKARCDRLAVTRRRIGQFLAALMLQVVERGERRNDATERGVLRDITHALAVDIDRAAVAEAFDIFAAGADTHNDDYSALVRSSEIVSSPMIDD